MAFAAFTTTRAQVVTKISISPVAGTVCPKTLTEYAVSLPSGFKLAHVCGPQSMGRLAVVTPAQQGLERTEVHNVASGAGTWCHLISVSVIALLIKFAPKPCESD